jgi:hypothetical protein
VIACGKALFSLHSGRLLPGGENAEERLMKIAKRNTGDAAPGDIVVP